MKNLTLFADVSLVCVLLLTACGNQTPAQVPTPTQPPVDTPTSMPTTTTEPTLAASPTPMPLPTLPPAEATVTFEGKQCTYDGPQSIAANMTFTVNVYVNSKDYSIYGLYAFIVGDGMTKDDLVAAIKREGAPPSWLTQAGSFDLEPRSSQQVTVKKSDGPLTGPIYLICFFSENGPFQIIGPIDVE
jgi:hypothetical protein